MSCRDHRRTIVMCAGMAAATAHAAGGHFDVDDASVLDPGQCQIETWQARAPAPNRTLFHLGPACRLGPVEVGINVDRDTSSADRHTTLGPQLKFVIDPLVDKLSAGLVWSAFFDLTHGGRPSQVVYAPVTWWAVEKFWLHANVGADQDATGRHTRRLGVSGEWAASDRLSVIAERIVVTGDWASRLGTRLTLTDSINVDLSVARIGPNATRQWVIGLNQVLAR